MGLIEKIPSNRRIILGSIFLIANALIWYFSAAKVLETVINSVAAVNSSLNLLMWSVHFGTLMLALIAGAYLTKKIQTRPFLILWTIIGTVSPIAILALYLAQVPVAFLVSFLFGLSLGLGMPVCMETFTNLTETKSRGRYAGLTMFLSLIGVVALALLNFGSIELTILILVIWRLLGLIAVVFQNSPKEIVKGNDVSFAFILRQRSFILYLIPWLMFSIVNYLSIPIQNEVLTQDWLSLLTIIESAIIGIFAIIGGYLLDIFGRKRIAMVGFILLGIGYSVLGLASDQMFSWFFYTVVDGIAWGIFYVIFVISIWSDLSRDGKSSKYYAIGILPFFISKYLQFVLGDFVAKHVLQGAVFSFIAIFLFIAVLPLVYAPETLPEKVMKDRDLKSYIENAKKKAQKEVDKAPNKKEKNPNTRSEEKPQDAKPDKTHEEATKLAEKYY